MKRIAAVIASIALTLTLAACGSSSSDSSTSAEASAQPSGSELVETPDRETLIAELRADGEASGASQEEIDCIVGAIEELDAGELQSIKDGAPSPETQEVMVAASALCQNSAEPSPASS